MSLLKFRLNYSSQISGGIRYHPIKNQPDIIAKSRGKSRRLREKSRERLESEKVRRGTATSKFANLLNLLNQNSSVADPYRRVEDWFVNFGVDIAD
jgi:hypothetical protein